MLASHHLRCPTPVCWIRTAPLGKGGRGHSLPQARRSMASSGPKLLLLHIHQEPGPLGNPSLWPLPQRPSPAWEGPWGPSPGGPAPARPSSLSSLAHPVFHGGCGTPPARLVLAPLTHGDVSGSAKQEVDKDRVEGTVEAKHGGQSSQEGIGQAWRGNGSNVGLKAKP